MYIKSGDTYVEHYTVPTFADGTDEEIATALEKHYAGEIDLTEYWSVGDKRTIHLNAMAADGVSESHHADDYEFVIIGMNHDDLTTPINGVTKAAITVQLDRMLFTDTTTEYYDAATVENEQGYMNSSQTNVGGWTSCARRTWCNSVFFNSLPSVIQNLVKNVDKKTSEGNQSSVINTDSDKVFLPSEIEILGSIFQSFSGEGTQYEYFETPSNIFKKPIWLNNTNNSGFWWERSPRAKNKNNYFCLVSNAGGNSSSIATGPWGISPAFCM